MNNLPRKYIECFYDVSVEEALHLPYTIYTEDKSSDACSVSLSECILNPMPFIEVVRTRLRNAFHDSSFELYVIRNNCLPRKYMLVDHAKN
jgi:hypothetical protein